MTLVRDYQRYLIAGDVFLFFTTIAAIVLLICSLCLIRRRKDPARTWIHFFKVTFAVFTIFVFLDLCCYSLMTAYSYLSGSYYSSASHYILRAISHVRSICTFFRILCDIFIFLTLISLGVGIAFARNGQSGSENRAIKWVAYGVVGVLMVLNLVVWSITEYISTAYYGDNFFMYDSEPLGSFLKLWNSERQILFSLVIALLLLALVLTAWSARIKIQTRSEERMKTTTTFLLVCCTLWLLQITFDLAEFVRFVNLKDVRHDPAYANYMYLITVFLSVWPKFIILCILFALGGKRRTGIWSADRSTSTTHSGGYGMPSQHIPWGGYSFYPPQCYVSSTQQNWQDPEQLMQPAPVYSQRQDPQDLPNVPDYPGIPPRSISSPPPPPSPPPHDEAMGLNHQADGTPPQTTTLPYSAKQ